MFQFKQFSIDDSACAMKVGTDAVLLGAWADVSNAVDIVDAGCGSGIISLMLAQRTSSAQIIAIDIDESACECCRSNADQTAWSERVVVCKCDITADFPDVRKPLLIVSNPPFYNEPLKSPDQNRALARHGDTFGLDSLIELAAQRITGPDDSLAFIAPAGRQSEIEWLLTCARLSPVRMTTVYSRIGKSAIRTLWQVIPESHALGRICQFDDLHIRDINNQYSAAYKLLTSQFYLDK